MLGGTTLLKRSGPRPWNHQGPQVDRHQEEDLCEAKREAERPAEKQIPW